MPYDPRPVLERFESGFDRRGPDDCWLWRGAPSRRGYGRIGIGGGRDMYVHRLALELKIGRSLTADEQTLHSCDTKLCVNPAHLRVGTLQENLSEAVERGLTRKSRCRRGHLHTPENTRSYTTKRGYTYQCCRECERLRKA